MGLINLVLIALTLFIAYQALKWIAWSNRRKAMRAAIASLPAFNCSKSHVGDGGRDGIAIDEKQAVLYFLRRSRGQVNAHRVSGADIVSSDVVEESETRTTQSGGGVIVMFGRIGVPVGGPRYKMRHYVSRVELRTGVSDPAFPTHSVTFLAATCKRGGVAHLFFSEQAREWQARIQRLAASAQVRPATIPASTQPFSVADELHKLLTLKGDGLLIRNSRRNARSYLPHNVGQQRNGRSGSLNESRLAAR